MGEKFIILIISLFAVHLNAQDTEKLLYLKDNANQLTGSFTNEGMKDLSNGFESSVDPKHYLVGGGDIFSIAVVGMPSVHYTITVNQRGDLFIPDLGLVNVNRKTLENAISTIEEFVQSKLKIKDQVYVTLTKCKKVLIEITGNVANPGTYTLDGSSRILDAIKQANSNVVSFDKMNVREVYYYSGSDSCMLDLLKFLYLNDDLSNPYIFPGDKIMIFPITRSVYIGGEINLPVGSGTIPLKAHETMAQLLSLFPFNASADSNKIMYQTNNSGSPVISTLSFQALGSIELHDGDAIIISKKDNYPKKVLVKVDGEITRPGTYPIIKGQTSVQEILNSAGGLTQKANQDCIYILHRKIPALKTSNGTSLNADNIYTTSIRPEINTAILNLNQSNDYALTEVTMKDQNKIILLEDDVVIVPCLDPYIYISGCVKKPGAYNYVNGKNLSFYIKNAGGFKSTADKTNILVMSHVANVTQVKSASALNPGDLIVVPDAPENKNFNYIILPVIQAVSTLLTVAVTTISLIITFQHK